MKKPVLWFIACLILIPAASRQAMGDEFQLTPSITIKEEYNDNILYTSSDRKSDFISTIVPGLSLLEKTERLNVSLSGRAESRFYGSHSNLNDTDQYYEGSGKYAVTPRFSISGKAFYSDDTRPDRDLEESGLVMSSVRRWRQNYMASADYALSEKTITSFSYEFLDHTFDSSEYSDLEAHTFNLTALHDLSGTFSSTKLHTGLTYSAYRIPGMKVDSGQATLGIIRDISEKWAFTIIGGVRYTESRFTVYTPQYIYWGPFIIGTRYLEEDQRNHGWGGVGHIALAYKGEKSSGELRAARDIMPASGRSGVSERTFIVFSSRRQLSSELFATLQGGYYINKSNEGEFSTSKIDEDTVRISPGVRYEFNKDTALEANYIYNKTWNNDSNTEAQRNIFQIRFMVQHDLFK